MKPRDLRELLGGYAAGTLTAEEREALFQAALDNQALFDALAGEEALRELLADPACRAQLLRDLDQPPAAFWQRFAEWMRKPATLAFAGSAAALVLMIGVVRFTQREPEAPKLVAQAPRYVELPRAASPVRQPEPKLMRPAAPPAETQVGKVRQEPAGQPTAAAQTEVGQVRQEPATQATAAAQTEVRQVRPESAAQATAAAPQPAAPKLMRPAAAPAQAQIEQVRQEVAAAEATAAASKPAALSCTVLTRSSQGDWIEAAPDATFREGAEVRLRVRPAEDGSILVAARDGATVTMLTPPPGAPVSSGQDLILPSAGAFELAGVSGEKNLRISFSPRSPAAPVTAFQFAKSAQVPTTGARAGVAGSAQAPAARRKGEAAKRKAETTDSREEAAKPPQVIELRLVYRSK